jgi:hypothetical protein
MNPKLTKWIKWIGLIKKDIVHLSTIHKVHADFVSIVKSNPIVNQENLFFWYIEQTYYSCILSGVRRHDIDKMCSASLANLLKDMIANPIKYNKNEYDRPEDKTFCEFGLIDNPEYADSTGSYLNEKLLKNDYSQLTQSIKSCCDFVDRKIAHLDARPMNTIFPPDYSTINDTGVIPKCEI